MRESTVEKLQPIINSGRGYVTTTELLNTGFTNRQISELLEMGELEKISHGQYWLIHSEISKLKEYKAIEIGKVNPEAVICADSACYLQGLIKVEPQVMSIATRRSDRHGMNMNFSVSRHYYAERTFEEECLTKSTPQGEYKIYNIDRSVCDCIRFQKDIEKDVFELIIDNYKKRQGAQIERLKAYAKLMRVGRKADEILGL